MTTLADEMQGYPQERVALDGFEATRRVLVPWEDRYAFVSDIIGQQYPYGSDIKAWALEADIDPFGKQEQDSESGGHTFAKYEKAVITIRYGHDAPELSNGDEVEERVEPTAEFLQLDHKLFRWGSGTGNMLNEKEAPGRIVRGLDYTKILHHVTNVPSHILEFVGAVNDSPITPVTDGMTGLTFQTETLLFHPPTLTRTITSSGALDWRITYRFSYNPNWDHTESPAVARGWNWFWRADTNTFEQLFVEGEGSAYKNYQPLDFTVI